MYQRILVPIDGSPTSDRGLEEAIRLAKTTCASLRLMHVVDMMTYAAAMDLAGATSAIDMTAAMREAGERILAQCRQRAEAADLDVSTVLVEGMSGSMAEHVVDEARRWSADLVVLGTHGRRGIGRFLLGSDAEQVLRSCPVPVLLVRAPEAVPPQGGLTPADAAGLGALPA